MEGQGRSTKARSGWLFWERELRRSRRRTPEESDSVTHLDLRVHKHNHSTIYTSTSI